MCIFNPRLSKLQLHIPNCLLNHQLESSKTAQTQDFLNWTHNVPLETCLSISCYVFQWHYHSINCTAKWPSMPLLSTSPSALATSLIIATSNTSPFSHRLGPFWFTSFHLHGHYSKSKYHNQLPAILKWHPNLPWFPLTYSPHWTTGKLFSKCS